MTTAPDLAAFRAISAMLTGIPAAQLCGDGDELLATHYQAALADDPDAFRRLLECHDAHRGSPPAVIVDAILNRAGAQVRFVARAIILGWYLGSWYPSDALEAACSQASKAGVSSTVLSARAYTHGWVWRIAQAHAMGHPAPPMYPWSAVPLPLSVATEGACT
jgi:hypothetical protein